MTKESIKGGDDGKDSIKAAMMQGAMVENITSSHSPTSESSAQMEVVANVCVICPQEEQDAMMVTLVCGHCYHGHCLDLWASKCREKGITRSCPMCHGPLTRSGVRE